MTSCSAREDETSPADLGTAASSGLPCGDSASLSRYSINPQPQLHLLHSTGDGKDHFHHKDHPEEQQSRSVKETISYPLCVFHGVPLGSFRTSGRNRRQSMLPCIRYVSEISLAVLACSIGTTQTGMNIFHEGVRKRGGLPRFFSPAANGLGRRFSGRKSCSGPMAACCGSTRIPQDPRGRCPSSAQVS